VNEDERAIRALIETWMTASRSGDTPTVLSLIADDVVFMTPGREPFGKEAFATASRGMGDAGVRLDGRTEIVELRVLDTWAYARVRIEVTMTRQGEAPVQRKGYSLTILRKDPDGRWVLARDANLVT
jgi:uncharacterized protein (TIGR02246 family)